MSEASDAIVGELSAFGRGYPGAHGKWPWPGHDDLAVRDKTFAYLPRRGSRSASLQASLIRAKLRSICLMPSPRAMGSPRAAGSHSLRPRRDIPPMEQLKEWIDESYRAQAPTKLVKDWTPDRLVFAMEAAAISKERAAPDGRTSATSSSARPRQCAHERFDLGRHLLR
jgi:hypothetical protein